MPKKPMTAAEMLDREFLNIRCRLLDIAAALDRIDRCDSPDRAKQDPRYAGVGEALGLLAEGGHDRAERIQMLFSDPYEG